MAPGIWNVRGDAVNPLERIERDGGGAGLWVRGYIQGEVTVLQFVQGIHGQGGAGNIAGLRLERGQGDGFDGWSGKD
jgi:hypothetical protein